MKLFLLTALLASHLSAGDAPRVPVEAIKQIEASTDARFAVEPWDSLGDTRGSYLPGYGAVFTFEMSLIQVTPISPFHAAPTPAEIKTVHERKLKQLAVLKSTLREMLCKAATSLSTLPGTEQITFEAYLFNQSYEDHTGLPHRLMITANRQKLVDAVARHASQQELASLVQEQEE